jgi:uncharacterized membrane protein YgcG
VALARRGRSARTCARFQALRATGMSTLLQFVNLSVQQSVYDMILPTQRRQLHVLVAEWYEDRYRGHLEPYWALLAHHWSSAERALGVHDAQSGPLLKKTIFYLAKAAEHARLMSANRVATEYYQSLLRIVRERPGSVDLVTVVEWASLCARTFARLGDIERTIELCRYAIDVAGFDQPESGTLSKLYRRIVPARLRQHSGNNASALASTSGGSGSMSGGGGGGGGGGNMSETYATRVQALISSVYVTLTFVYMTMNEPSIAIECAVLGHACGEKAGDAVMTADAQGMLCAIRGAAGDSERRDCGARARHYRDAGAAQPTPRLVRESRPRHGVGRPLAQGAADARAADDGARHRVVRLHQDGV